MLSDYLPVLIMSFMGLVTGCAFVALAYFLGPKVTNRIKEMPFESGLVAKGTNKQKIGVKFYLVAMIFLVFDIEIIFLYPYAVKFRELGWGGFAAILFFLSVLSAGIFYEWKKGALEWQ